jgi:hypothetical protein
LQRCIWPTTPKILKEVGEIPETNFELARDPVSNRKHPGNFSVAESPCKSAAEQNQVTDACVTRIKK